MMNCCRCGAAPTAQGDIWATRCHHSLLCVPCGRILAEKCHRCFCGMDYSILTKSRPISWEQSTTKNSIIRLPESELGGGPYSSESFFLEKLRANKCYHVLKAGEHGWCLGKVKNWVILRIKGESKVMTLKKAESIMKEREKKVEGLVKRYKVCKNGLGVEVKDRLEDADEEGVDMDVSKEGFDMYVEEEGEDERVYEEKEEDLEIIHSKQQIV